MKDHTRDRLYSTYASTHAGMSSAAATRLTFEREILPHLDYPSTAAVLLIGQTGTVSATSGLPPLLIGLVAVVVGGLGSLPGAVLGAYVLGVTSVALQSGLPVGARPFRDAFLFGIVILILLLRPQGIVAQKVRV